MGMALVIDLAGGAVQAQPVALVEGLAGELELLVLLIHNDVGAAGHAAGAHAAGHDGGVGGHAAADSQDALGGLHALDILGRGLQADQDHLLAPGGPLLGVLSGEDDLAGGGAGGGGQSRADDRSLLQDLGVKLGVEQGVQRAGARSWPRPSSRRSCPRPPGRRRSSGRRRGCACRCGSGA